MRVINSLNKHEAFYKECFPIVLKSPEVNEKISQSSGHLTERMKKAPNKLLTKVLESINHQENEATMTKYIVDRIDRMYERIVKNDNMRDAVVKDLMRDTIVKSDGMRDAIVKNDKMCDAVCKFEKKRAI